MLNLPPLDTLLPLPTGLVAVTGDERTGKTTLLQRIAERTGGLWLDLALPGQDELTLEAVWHDLATRSPAWNAELCADLAEALGLSDHAGKRLFMLSAGSRRKVGLVGLLASGAAVTCVDQPYAALDLASIAVLREVLNDAADHATRTWVVADYEADAALRWQRVISLDAP